MPIFKSFSDKTSIGSSALIRELSIILIIKLALIWGIYTLYFSNGIEQDRVEEVMAEQWGLAVSPAATDSNMKEKNP